MIFYKSHLKFDFLSFIKDNSYFAATQKGDSLKTMNLSRVFSLNFCCGYSTNRLLVKQKVEGNSAFPGLLGVDIAKKQNKKREKKRSSYILPKHIGRVFFVHNGRTFSSIHIYRKMLGHKFGEFASTRKRPVHKKKR